MTDPRKIAQTEQTPPGLASEGCVISPRPCPEHELPAPSSPLPAGSLDRADALALPAQAAARRACVTQYPTVTAMPSTIAPTPPHRATSKGANTHSPP